MQVITSERVPIKLWDADLEEGAKKQAYDLANLPFAFKHVAVMADGHQGYGMPIGGVLATKGTVIPGAVGVDIGCGVRAMKIECEPLTQDELKQAATFIRERVPVGFNHHDKPQEWSGFKLNTALDLQIVRDELQSASHQLGTLGGGNHFMEFQLDEDNNTWLMLHSGSRNFGYKIAKFYTGIAKDTCAKYYSAIPTPDLAFLPLDTAAGKNYMTAMNYALEFAKESRRRMLVAMVDAVMAVRPSACLHGAVDVHHNYARWENHFGTNVMLHRKGATSAQEDELGIIPGSQGTASYIVKGKGNKDSFMSCSHGAGRRMSRTKAKHELNLNDEVRKMDEAGIVHSMTTADDLDESASAYKDIDAVMVNQADLVDVVTKLRPIMVIKG